MSDLRTLLGMAAPYRFVLASGGVLMLAESAAALAVPWIGGQVVRAILDGGGSGTALPTVLAAMLGLFAAQALLRFGAACLVDSATDRIVADLKVSLYDHLQALPIAFFHERRLGDSLALLTSDVYVMGAFLSGTAVALVPLAVTGAGAAILMFGIRADLALLATILVPAVYLALKVAGRRIRPLAARLQDEEASAIALAQENLGMLSAIKVFAREPHESERYRAQVGRVLALAARQRRILAAFAPTVQFVAGAAVVLLIAIASTDLFAGRLSPADLVAFLLYTQLLTRPVSGLADVYGRTQAARGALGRLERVMAEPREAPPHAGVRLPRVHGDIEWRGVTFGYAGRAPALDCVNLRIAAGEWIAIVGPNGAGKSTLTQLLVRLHEPAAGSITVDGVDIARVSLASLRAQVGVVPQHVMLFNATLRENIEYGRADADAAAVERAARAAGAHDFIARLPMGYETVVGDRGVRLSGGEQQRLALARALLKDPPILVLDEATAMFDPEGEAQFLLSCRQAFGRRTVIFITHRPASLAVVDRIVHMRSGRVERIEAGVARGLRLVGQG
jgi:subfamily B ATP-binding cassette protein MsbA